MIAHIYVRYGGMCQTQPLTEEEKRYDETCRAIDYAEREILSKPLSLFMASEFIWFSGFINHTFFFPNQKQLDEQLRTLGELLKVINERESKQ